MSETGNSTESLSNDHQTGLSLVEMLVIVAEHKKTLVALPLFVGILALSVSFLIPNVYTGTATVLPPQQSQSNALALLGQFGVLGTAAGQSFGLKNPSEIFVEMLKSRTVLDTIITRFDLQKLYDEEYLVDTRKKLKKRLDISAAKSGVITIQVDDHDPRRAASMANAFAEELEKLTFDLAVTEASQRRLFFERQLLKAKEDLSSAEISMKQFQEKSGLIKPNDQAEITVSASANLRAQITAKEVQLTAMQSFATTHNPDIIRLEKEIGALRKQLARIEREPTHSPGDLLVPIGRVPEAGLEYVQRARDVKYQETLFEILAKQYELARIDEAKNATLIQVLDKAVVPERKTAPTRSLIAIVATVVAFFLCSIWVLTYRRMRGASEAFSKQLVLLRTRLRQF
jgi:tyrosine-protein kinase Etk/Wzc